MIKVPDYNGGFVSKQVEGNFVVTRDSEGYLLNSEPVNFIKKSLECKYGTVIDYSTSLVVLKKGTKTVKVNRGKLNNYLSLQLEANQEPPPQKLLVTGTFETEAGKVLVKGIDDNLRSVFCDPDKIEVDKKKLVFRKSIGNKTYFAEAEQVEKQMLVKSIDVSETFKQILIKGVATTLKPPSISTGDAWNKKGGTKPGHKYLERKPHPSGEGYVYLYKLPNGNAEWRDDNGKVIDVKDTGEHKPYSVDEFKIGDNVKQGDELGRVEDVSANLLAVNFGGKVQVINKKDHVEKLKEHQLYKPGQIIKTNKGDAKILQMTDRLALIKMIDDNVLSVINLEKHITKIKKEDTDNLRSNLNKYNYVNEGYAETDYEHSFSKVDYKNTKEFQQYQDKATEAGFGDGELKRKKYVKAGNNIHTVEWRYDPHSKETIFYADGVKNLPVEFAGKRYSVTDIDSEGYTLNGDGESGLRLSHKDYKQYWDEYRDEQKRNSVKTSDAYGDTISSPKTTFHISGKLSDEQLAKIEAEKQSGSSYKVRWKNRDEKLQTDEDKAQIEAERQQKLVNVKQALGSDAYKQFEDTAKARGFDISENKFNAQKTIEIEGNKFVVQSEFDPEAGTSNRVTGKYSNLELGNNMYPITDITKDRVFYNEQGTEQSISIDELKQINGKKVFEPTRESKGFISKNPATRFYFSPDEGDAVSGFYEVIELDDLIASHKAGGETNPLYSIGDAQNRDRSKQQSKAQIAKIAANPNFDWLSDNRTVQDGSPVVNEDYEIIAGNGRGIGIGEHYEQGGDKYKNDLISNAQRLGFNADDLSGMSKPVLVRRVNVDNQEAQRLGAKSNEGNMLKTEAREEAKGKATRIDDKTFNSIADVFKSAKGDYSSLSDYLEDIGGDLVRKLSEKGIISDNEKHLYYDLESGKLNASHKDRLKELLTQSILGDSSKHFEKIPDAAREGITKGLGELFSIKGQSSDLVPHLQNAVKILAKYSAVKDKFSNPDEFIAQDANNMLDPLKGDKKDLALFDLLADPIRPDIYGNEKDTVGKPKKKNMIAKMIKKYTSLVEGDMFEPPMQPDEAFNEVFKPKYDKGINKSLINRMFSKLFKSQQMDMFTGQTDEHGNVLMPSKKNPNVRRYQKQQEVKSEKQEATNENNYDIKDRNKLQVDILQEAGIPEDDIPDYVLDSVADGKILGKRAEAVIDGDISKDEAVQKVKEDYEKMKSGKKDTKFLEQEGKKKKVSDINSMEKKEIINEYNFDQIAEKLNDFVSSFKTKGKKRTKVKIGGRMIEITTKIKENYNWGGEFEEPIFEVAIGKTIEESEPIVLRRIQDGDDLLAYLEKHINHLLETENHQTYSQEKIIKILDAKLIEAGIPKRVVNAKTGTKYYSIGAQKIRVSDHGQLPTNPTNANIYDIMKAEQREKSDYDFISGRYEKGTIETQIDSIIKNTVSSEEPTANNIESKSQSIKPEPLIKKDDFVGESPKGQNENMKTGKKKQIETPQTETEEFTYSLENFLYEYKTYDYDDFPEILNYLTTQPIYEVENWADEGGDPKKYYLGYDKKEASKKLENADRVEGFEHKKQMVELIAYTPKFDQKAVDTIQNDYKTLSEDEFINRYPHTVEISQAIEYEVDYDDRDSLDSKDISPINKTTDDILYSVQKEFRGKYRDINLGEDEKGETHYLKLRIADHSGKWQNNVMDENVLSIVIANDNKTSHFQRGSEGIRNEHFFDEENTAEEIIEFINNYITELQEGNNWKVPKDEE